MPRFREEVINVKLADIFVEHGIGAHPETKFKESGKRGLPDVMILQQGIKVNLEGRLGSSPQARDLEAHCIKRVEEGIADVAIGVLYPPGLDDAKDVNALTKKISNSRFDSMVIYMSSRGIEVIKTRKITISDLLQSVLNAFSAVVNNDIVRNKVLEVEQALDETTKYASEQSLFFSSEKLVE